MLPRFFDIHAHLHDPAFAEDRSEVIQRMKEKGVWAITVGTDRESSQDARNEALFNEEGVYACVGVHPTDNCTDCFSEEYFNELVGGKHVVAIGECGIDYSRLDAGADNTAEKQRQRTLFEDQVDFAIKHNLPLMLHVRDNDKSLADAHRDVLEILKRKKEIFGEPLRGNVHFFAQTLDIAREYFELGFTISFTGVITFTNEYDEVIRAASLDQIMSETDCPYVAPVPHRGERNEPAYVEEVVKRIAEIRNEDFETVRLALVGNALRVFAIKV